MTILATIREKLSGKEQQERDAELEDYNALVLAVADGKEPAQEDVERLLAGGTAERFEPVCPTHPSHRRVRIRRTVDNVHHCICDDCGTDFTQEFDPHAEAANGRTVQDLERDVELLKQRRQWAEQVATIPQLEETERQAKDRRERVCAKYRKAQEEMKRVTEEVASELLALNMEKSSAEKARWELIQHCRDVGLREQYSQLLSRRKDVSGRLGAVKHDLWGSMPVGKLTDPERDSTGAKMLALQQKLEKWSNDRRNGHRNSLSVEKLNREYQQFRSREWNPKVKEHEQLTGELAEIDEQLSQLMEKMLAP